MMIHNSTNEMKELLYEHDPSDCSTAEFESHDDDHDKSIAKGGVTTPFPWKLHEMLDDMAHTGDNSVVCWQPHGRAFMVHKPKEFVEKIMHHYFNQTKYASFQRQLNLYGFSRLSHGRDKGAYYHKCFVRGERNLCRGMIRQKIKGTKVRRSLGPEDEPNFYSVEYQTKYEPPMNVAIDSHDSSPIITTSYVSPLYKPVLIESDLPQSSLLSLVKEAERVNPSPQQVLSLTPHQQAFVFSPPTLPTIEPDEAKAGDVIFFEGRPFRYLEHLEVLPPPPPTSLQTRAETYKDSLHGMINFIVNMEVESQPICSV